MSEAIFPSELLARASALLQAFRSAGLTLATAESCTGGLIAGLLTEVPGSSDVVERGFVTYSNKAKIEAIGVAPALVEAYGAVSAEVARAMAQGALQYSRADVAVAVTGVAGPGGGSEAKPVGLVHLAAARRNGATLLIEKRYGDLGRSGIRMATVDTALGLLTRTIGAPSTEA